MKSDLTIRVLQSTWMQGGGRVRKGGGVKAAITTDSPICILPTHDTQKLAKIDAVNATAWRFLPEDVVKTKLII
jgi:hypothetical protein